MNTLQGTGAAGYQVLREYFGMTDAPCLPNYFRQLTGLDLELAQRSDAWKQWADLDRYRQEKVNADISNAIL